MYSIGEAVNIDCVDPNSFVVSWKNSMGTVITFGYKSATLTINSIMDIHHEEEYTCTIESSGAVRDLNYTIIVIGTLYNIEKKYKDSPFHTLQ